MLLSHSTPNLSSYRPTTHGGSQLRRRQRRSAARPLSASQTRGQRPQRPVFCRTARFDIAARCGRHVGGDHASVGGVTSPTPLQGAGGVVIDCGVSNRGGSRRRRGRRHRGGHPADAGVGRPPVRVASQGHAARWRRSSAGPPRRSRRASRRGWPGRPWGGKDSQPAPTLMATVRVSIAVVRLARVMVTVLVRIVDGRPEAEGDGARAGVTTAALDLSRRAPARGRPSVGAAPRSTPACGGSPGQVQSGRARQGTLMCLDGIMGRGWLPIRGLLGRHRQGRGRWRRRPGVSCGQSRRMLDAHGAARGAGCRDASPRSGAPRIADAS